MRNSRLPRQAESANSARRSFFWKLGAGVSAALASTAGIAGNGNGNGSGGTHGSDDAALKLAVLEAENALRKLHQAYESAMDKGQYDAVIGMFADDAEVIFDGEVFSGRARDVSRLYRDRFRAGKTGRRMEPAPGFELDAEQLQERVAVAPDMLSASAEFPLSIQVGEAIETETSLADMARLHDEGVRTWWEGGMYAVRYVRDTTAGPWRIARLQFRTLSRADFRPGRTYARPLANSAPRRG